MRLFGLEHMRFPVPVDPDDPDKGTREVGAGFFTNELIRISQTLHDIRTGQNVQEEFSYTQKTVLFKDGGAPAVPFTVAFDPVPSGTTWELHSVLVSVPEAAGASGNGINGIFYRNGAQIGSEITDVTNGGIGITGVAVHEFFNPPRLRQNESLVFKGIMDFAWTGPVAVTVRHRAITIPPQTLDPTP